MKAGWAEHYEHKQDRRLLDLELGVFGVFDGIGEFAASGEAAAIAAAAVLENCRNPELDTLDSLIKGCNQAGRDINHQVRGATTATMVRIRGEEMAWVSIGDSRLYLKRANQSLEQVSQDEGEGNIVDNYLGYSQPWHNQARIEQKGILPVAAGDMIILVTDGVTGDFGADILHPWELEPEIDPTDPQVTADNLLRIATKVDDRTAVVVYL